MGETTVGWFPVFTLLLGYAVKAAADWLQHRRTSEREREARNAAREDHLFERRTAFQRQTLLDLQDAMMDLVRTTGEMHHHDVVSFRQTGKWQKQLFSEDLAEANRLANARTSMLAVRVRDETVRNLVTEVKNHSTKAAMCASLEEGDRALGAMGIEFDSLNRRIGEVLCDLDDEPSMVQSSNSTTRAPRKQ